MTSNTSRYAYLSADEAQDSEEATTSPTSESSDSGNSYEDTLADLTRDQWADFQTRYLPVQDDLLALSSNDTLLNEQLARNETNVNNSFALAEQGENIRMGRMGLAAQDSEQSKTNTGLLKNLTTASVNNSSRSSAEELQTQIITGQSGTPSSLADIGDQT